MSTEQDLAYERELVAEAAAIQRLLANLPRVKAQLRGDHGIATTPISGYHYFLLDGLLVCGFDANPVDAVEVTTEQDIRDWCQCVEVLDDINRQIVQWLADPQFVPDWAN